MSFGITVNQSTGFSIYRQYPSMSLLSDDFNDNSLDATKWYEWTAGDVSETGQALNITSTTAASYKGMDSVSTGDLTGLTAYVEVAHILTGLTSAGTYFQLTADASNNINIYVNSADITASKTDGGVYSTVSAIPYNPAVHRWWRIRESGGVIYYDYSASGFIWVNFTSTTVNFSVKALMVSLFIGTDGANTLTDTAIFDNFNVAPVASADITLPRGQYRNNQYTAVAVGGSTLTDGISNNIWLDADVYSTTPTATTTLKVEAEVVGTSFDDAPTATGSPRILKVSELPTFRRGGCLVYDAKNKRFIQFGGYDGTTRYNDVWEITAESAYHRWHKLSPSGTPPTAKNLAASTYVRGTTSGSVDKAYMVIWGGSSPSDLNEMHALDISTPGSESWGTITQTSAPIVRSYLTNHMVGKSTASNTTDLYLFGGWGAARYNDLYRCTFNVNTPTAVTWTTLKANGTAGNPTIRSGCGMIYDSANNRLIISGGYSGSTYLADAWQFSIGAGTFSQLSPTGTAPGGRELGAIAYDSVNHRAIIIGGWQGSAATGRNDIIQLSLTSGSEAWTTIKSYDSSNQGTLCMSSVCTAVDTARNIMVMSTINGYDSTTKYVYAFDMNDTSATAPMHSLNIVDYFRGRDAPSAVYNSTRGEMLFINGYGMIDDDATIARGDHTSELWVYSRTSNTWRYGAAGPFTIPQCEGSLSVYDSANDRVIYFGGLTGNSRRSSDVWSVKANAHGGYETTKLAPTGTIPGPRWLMAGCYDAARGRMIIWGGQDNGIMYNDVWALSLTSGSEAWTQLSPTGSAPTAVWQPSYAHDTVNNRLYVHGGTTNDGGTTFTSQLFYLDLATVNGVWNNTGVTGGLAVRGAVMGYDSTNSRLICFGGFDGSVVNNTVRYTSTSSFTSWTTQATANTPAARRSAGAAVVDGKFIVSCGRPASGTWFSDTQELNIDAAPASWSWTDKSPKVYQTMSVPLTGLVLGSRYHWQAWGTTTGKDSDSPVASFGSNAESATDFIVNSGVGGQIKAYVGGAWNAKPVKVWNGISWVEKPLKVWNGASWNETTY
jgi:hypothetical protein